MSTPFSKKFIGKNPITKKQTLEDVVGQLKNTSKMHLAQAETVDDHIKEMKQDSPIQSAYQAGAGASIYASNRDAFSNMFNQLTSATVNLINKRKDPEAVAERLEKRVERRNKRSVNRGEGTFDGAPEDKKFIAFEDSKFNVKTDKIKSKLKIAKEKARKAKEQKIKDAAAMRGTKTPQQKALDKEAEIAATYELRNPDKKYSDLTDKEKAKFMFNNRFTQLKPE